jgi:hypothetical protein
MDAHHLNEYQKVEQLHSSPALGAQKPSEMLAEMLRLCPRSHEANPFFTYLFLHQLRVLLATEDHADRHALAARADQLWVHKKRNVNNTIAAVSGYEEEGVVAAVRHQPSIAKKKPPPLKKAGNGGAKRLSLEDQQAMDESGLCSVCWYHFSFADLPQTLHVAGKLSGRASINAVTPSALVHVKDDISKRRFLRDTDASYSIFPHTLPLHRRAPHTRLNFYL